MVVSAPPTITRPEPYLSEMAPAKGAPIPQTMLAIAMASPNVSRPIPSDCVTGGM